MTIEFHTLYDKVSPKLLSSIRNEIIDVSHTNKNISRAEIFLKTEENSIENENKICEIRLVIYGDDIFVHARSENFENAAKEAIKKVTRILKQQAGKQNEPPDVTTSTVTI
jgi:ribosome-associated translation inhibitor RaiA